MAIRYHLVEPGMTLWQKKRITMGNTTIRRDAWYTVHIVEKHERHCVVSWNGNTPRPMYARDVEKLFRKKPEAGK